MIMQTLSEADTFAVTPVQRRKHRGMEHPSLCMHKYDYDAWRH